MTVSLDDMMAELDPRRQRRIEDRAAELIAEEMTLRERRKACALTQASVARKLGIGQDVISRPERRSVMVPSGRGTVRRRCIIRKRNRRGLLPLSRFAAPSPQSLHGSTEPLRRSDLLLSTLGFERSENGNSASRGAKGRPDFEKICIRYDDGCVFGLKDNYTKILKINEKFRSSKNLCRASRSARPTR